MAKPIVVTVGVDNNFATLLFAMATSLKKIGKWGTDPSYARRALSLSYGENIAKIGQVYLEIFD